MHLPNWLRRRRPHTIHRRPSRICRFVRLQLEALEERITPTGPITIQAANAAQLQAAITTADSNAGQQYLIQLTGTSPYNLTTELDVTNTAGVTITGSSTVLNAAANHRVFSVESGAALALQNLTVQKGNVTTHGGGILDQGGNLMLTNVVVQSNSVHGAAGVDARGGGIYVAGGTLTITNSTIQNNTARGGDGSIPKGADTSPHLDPSNNGGAGYGGGIFVSGGTLTITNSTIQNNTARGGDGIAGTASSVSGNGGVGSGGGIYATTPSNTVPRIAEQFGSTISPYVLRVSQFTITNSTISANVSRGGLGGAGSSQFGSAGNGGVGGDGYGGGVSATASNGSINLKNNSISGNQVFGGSGGAGGNAGFGNNTGGKGGDVFGGGLYVGGTANLTNNSVTLNTAAGGNGGNGGIGISLPGGHGGDGGDVSGGGLDATSGDSFINNTVALNTGVGGGGGNGGNGGNSGIFASGGHGGNGGSTSGGGIEDASSSGQNSYLNNTLAFNNATGGTGGQGGKANSGSGSAAPAGTAGGSNGGGLDVQSNAPIFSNNLLQRNMAASSGPDYFGSVDSAATNNFVSNTTGAKTFNPRNNILNSSTNQLGSLATASNGTSYYPLSSLLPIVQSINGGTNSVLSTIATAEGVPQSQATDQIGNPRIVSPKDTIDIGAVEFQGFPTTTLTSNVSVPYTISDPPLSNTATLTANLTDSEGIPINEGEVTFVVKDSSGAQLGVKCADVQRGQANAPFTVPPQTALGNYTITAQYDDNSPNPIFANSSGTGTLTVAPSPTTVTINNVSVFYGLGGEQDTITAYVLGNPQTVGRGFVVNEGFVTLSDSGQTATVRVVNSVATATFNIPLIAEIQLTHSITAAYSPGNNNYLASSSIYTINQAQIIMDFLIQLMILEFIMNSMSGR